MSHIFSIPPSPNLLSEAKAAHHYRLSELQQRDIHRHVNVPSTTCVQILPGGRGCCCDNILIFFRLLHLRRCICCLIHHNSAPARFYNGLIFRIRIEVIIAFSIKIPKATSFAWLGSLLSPFRLAPVPSARVSV